MPATNLVAEAEMQEVLAAWPTSMQRPVVHISRVRFSTPFSSDPRRYLSELAENAGAAAEVLPLRLIGAVGFCCSSSSALFADQLKASVKIPVLTAHQSMLLAAQRLAVRRVVLVTPYPAQIGRELAVSFSRAGLQVVAQRHLGLDHGEQYLACDVVDEARSLVARAKGRAGGVVLSCTNVGTLDHIQALERGLDMPVISSNASLFWGLLRAVDTDTSLLPMLGVLSSVR